MNSSQGLIFQFMKFKTSPAFPWLLTVMCKPSLQDDITLSCCGISQRLRVPPDVLINAVVTLMLESHASLNPVGQTNQVLVRGWTYWGMLSCNWFTQICDCFRCDFNKQFFKDPELITNHLWLEPRHSTATASSSWKVIICLLLFIQLEFSKWCSSWTFAF